MVATELEKGEQNQRDNLAAERGVLGDESNVENDGNMRTPEWLDSIPSKVTY